MASSLSIRENVRLAPMTTLGIGGPARYFAEAREEGEVPEAFAFARRRGLPVFVLGGGSNVLVADEGFSGLALRVAIEGVEWRAEGGVTACAGEDWDSFVRECVARDLAGVECLSGIPGSVGGTPVQNVGAYGQEVAETITGVRAFDRRAGRIVALRPAECGFGYRSSIFNTTEPDRYVVMAVTYRLKPGGAPALRYPDVRSYFAGRPDAPTLREVREAVREIRARKAMLLSPEDPDCRSAGSFFKNPVLPPENFARVEREARRLGLIRDEERVPGFAVAGGAVKLPAAWLIERAGFQKGHIHAPAAGRVGISSKHTLAIINRGGASARDMLEFAGEIQRRVHERFGVRLVPEPVFLGFLTP
ncbi:MAG: UDP-N-acetylmuramate dehydrogenase [Blastocatellia bacterium]